MPFQGFDCTCASSLQVLSSHMKVASFGLKAGSSSLTTGHHPLEVGVKKMTRLHIILGNAKHCFPRKDIPVNVGKQQPKQL